MKKKIIIIGLLFSISVLQSCYNRVGRLTVAATRNVDSKTDYVLLKKDVKGKAKTKKDNALEIAIDKAVEDFPTGEFMKNAVFSVSLSGKKIKVVGDVWGTPAQTKK